MSIPLHLWKNSSWEVVQPHKDSASSSPSVPSAEAEAAYISREFMDLTNQQDQVITIPSDFPLSPQKKDGELAEMKLFEAVKKAGANTPGLRMLIFNGLRCSGVKEENSDKKLIREIDLSVFCEYQGKHFITFLEVKCCNAAFKQAWLQKHRKKATGQLKTHTEILIHNFGISSTEAEKVQLHTVWPNLSANEPCDNPDCEDNNSHLRFQPKPKPCWPPGMSQEPNYEKPGWHLFEDDVNQFEVVLQSMITDTTIDIEEQTWITMLGVHTRLSCGALYDNISKKFFLLGPEQVNLRDSSEHNLMDPRIIQGVAGTGKSTSVTLGKCLSR